MCKKVGKVGLILGGDTENLLEADFHHSSPSNRLLTHVVILETLLGLVSTIPLCFYWLKLSLSMYSKTGNTFQTDFSNSFLTTSSNSASDVGNKSRHILTWCWKHFLGDIAIGPTIYTTILVRYIRVIVRCWGNSSILCQQNSDAL